VFSNLLLWAVSPYYYHFAKDEDEDYLENDLVDENLKRYFYSNITGKLLSNMQ